MKKLFFIYSCVPLFWIIAALLGSHFNIRFIDPCLWLIFGYWFIQYYIYFFLIEAALVAFLLFKRNISIIGSLIGIALMLFGIFASHYCDAHNIWNVSGWLSD